MSAASGADASIITLLGTKRPAVWSAQGRLPRTFTGWHIAGKRKQGRGRTHIERLGHPVLFSSLYEWAAKHIPPRDRSSPEASPRGSSGGPRVPTPIEVGRQCGLVGKNGGDSPLLPAARAPISPPHVLSSPIPPDEREAATRQRNSGRPERAIGTPKWRTHAA